jgi:hypothetical protein
MILISGFLTHRPRRGTAVALFLALGLSPTWAADPAANTILPADLSAYRSPTAEWEAVQAVILDPADFSRLKTVPGTGVLVNGSEGRTVDLLTREEFGDIEVHVEFCISKKSNSGIYLMGRYEVQIYDSYGVAKDQYPGIECGGIYPRWTSDRGEFEGHSPRVNASKAAGQWQAFDITFRAPRFNAVGDKTAHAKFIRVVHNGQLVHDNVEVTGPTRAAHWNSESPTGPLMIQGDHGPVAIRNVVVRRIPDGDPSAANSASSREFFVAPRGDDTHPGTRIEPFQSFQRAQQAVRAERHSHPNHGVTVTFLSGRYELAAAIGFTAADSGASADRPVLYRAEPGAEVVISGGQLIAGWLPHPAQPGTWRTRIANPQAEGGESWRFEQLWVNDRRAVRARTPN